MKNKKSRIAKKLCACIMFTMTLVFSFFLEVHAEDNRTEITNFQVTSDFVNIISNGNKINTTKPTLSCADDRVNVSYPTWKKYNKSTKVWDNQYNGEFSPGEWRCWFFATIENPSEYKFAGWNKTSATINGITAAGYGAFGQSSGYDMAQFTVESTSVFIGTNEFKFFQTIFSIPGSVAGSNITTVDLSGCVSGGQGTITFEKVSGPDWIEVSSDGKITGKPTAQANSNPNLVVSVKDEASNEATATLSVGATAAAGTKSKITTIEATSDISKVIVEGQKVAVPSFTMQKGSPAIVVADKKNYLFKEGENTIYTGDSDGNFEAGTYDLYANILLGSEYLSTYEFGITSEMSVKIDNELWLVTAIDNNYSYNSKTYSRCRVKKTINIAKKVKQITITPSELTLTEGETGTLSIIVTPSDATEKAVVWSCESGSCAYVDDTGVVTACYTGSCTVKAKALDGSGCTATCKVTVTKKGNEETEIKPISVKPSPGEKSSEEQKNPGSTVTEAKPKVEGDLIVDEGTKTVFVVTSSDPQKLEVEFKTASNVKSSETIVIPEIVSDGKNNYTVTSVADGAFVGNKKITTVVFPNSIQKIGEGAFDGCSSLVTADLSKTSTEVIGKRAFAGTKIKNFTVPDSVITIEQEAFANCKNLQTLVLGKKTDNISATAFTGCVKCKNVTIKSKKAPTKKGIKWVKKLPKKVKIKVHKKLKKKYVKVLKSIKRKLN